MVEILGPMMVYAFDEQILQPQASMQRQVMHKKFNTGIIDLAVIDGPKGQRLAL